MAFVWFGSGSGSGSGSGFRGSSSGPGEAVRRACGVCEKRAEAVCGLSNAADSGVLAWRTLGAE